MSSDRHLTHHIGMWLKFMIACMPGLFDSLGVTSGWSSMMFFNSLISGTSG